MHDGAGTLSPIDIGKNGHPRIASLRVNSKPGMESLLRKVTNYIQ
jgi:hypothetical protein